MSRGRPSMMLDECVEEGSPTNARKEFEAMVQAQTKDEAEELRKLYAASWRQSDVALGLKQPRPGIIANANAALEALRADAVSDGSERGESQAEQDDWTNQVWIWFKSLAISACCVRK
ncbi:unnamed protein product [Durusdinium trenchii]|uniref:Uncharacterized protein n=1 Tax=Durusdinium trenchii TaxID=1381693 RepID=A0ABP0NEJ1_9DINO